MDYLTNYQKYLNSFQKYLLENEKSKSTIEAYISDTKLFLFYLNKNNIELDSLTSIVLNEYKDNLHSKNYNIKTINRKLVSINQFLQFLDIDVHVKQEKIQSQNFLDFLFTKEEISKMIAVTEIDKDYRAKALIFTAKSTGMRVSELLQLTINDVGKDTVLICGKGRKYRNVFISDKLKLVLNEYLQHRKTKYKTNKLFVGQRGAINRHTVYTTIRKYAEKCDVDWRKAHTHNLRHHFARELLNTYEVDIATVSDVLGHENLNTTRIYLRKSKGELLDIMNKIE
ncbi:tyrosine-type recombinase/integrase [Clostridium botulinum]|nr:tyrosine-type recombinase/integrase [Clostridium botulinum]EKS4395666.1 tyrosine-type recombinase/integrase [Clostridium botulinum]